MWVFTQDGFISAVNNGQVPGKLAVRARDKVSLELLAAFTEQDIQKSTNTDYPYRVFVTKEQLAEYLAVQIDAIDYANFKDRVWATRGDKYHRATGAVWEAMLGVTDSEARGIGLYS